MKNLTKILFILLLFSSINLFGFNFLVNLFFGMLPQPVRSAFKGEGLSNLQLDYGFGNSAFTSISYLTSKLDFHEGPLSESYTFNNPTYATYAGYIAHVSTPVLLSVYPGWQLELEAGFGGTDYDSARENTKKFYFSGMTGFNWEIYKSQKVERFSWLLNLGFGYKLHSFLKDVIYYNLQVGTILVPKKVSCSLEYLSSIQGGTFFFYSSSTEKINSKEQNISLSLNLLLSENYALKFGGTIKDLSSKQMFSIIESEKKINYTGFHLTLLSK